MAASIEKVDGDTHKAVYDKGSFPFETKYEGFRMLWEEYQLEDLSTEDALALAFAMQKLEIPSFPENFPDIESWSGEFTALIYVLKQKTASEADGEPRMFMCPNCGLHAYFVGKDFFYLRDIYSTNEALIAIDWAVTGKKIPHEKGLNLLEVANTLVFPVLDETSTV